MTNQWLVVTDADSIHLYTWYSLPGLQFRGKLRKGGWPPNTDSDGMIYVPYQHYIDMLEISSTGNVSVRGSLTAGGRLTGLVTVSMGPQPGQLCAGGNGPPTVYTIHTKNDSIDQILVLPSELHNVWSVAALGNGQILASDYYGNLAWYRSVLEPAVLLTNTPYYGG